MMRKSVLLFGILFFLSSVMTTISLPLQARAQEESESKEDKGCEPCKRARRTKRVSGDIINIDSDNNQLALTYIDYETDKKKEITIYADEKTKFKHVNFLKDLKVGDGAKIHYIIDPEGRPIALRISLKLPESEE